jgi:triose-phosphate isomerase
MKRKIVAGNWKMNKTREEAVRLIGQIESSLAQVASDVELYVFPPFPHLGWIDFSKFSNLKLGAQDCSDEENGAFTGEVSAAIIASFGAKAVIIGHSERRARFGEKEDLLRRKIAQAQKQNLEVFYCVGESDKIRSQGIHVAWEHVERQLVALEGADLDRVVIAYEPIWAIGTGKSATAEDAGWMCARIVAECKLRWHKEIPVLYGGSCNPTNARDIFAQDGVSGGLIGGASLKAEQFIEIAKSF